MTVRSCYESMLRFLRTEQRTIPHTDTDFQNPIYDGLEAMNATLQHMAVMSPLFAVKQGRSAYFRAPVTLTATVMTEGLKVCTLPTGDDKYLGCQIQLPGDPAINRIVSRAAAVYTLQFPHLSSSTSGSAVVSFDAAELDSDIIKVLDPVMPRGGGTPFRPANGRHNLLVPYQTGPDDYGRPLTQVGGTTNSVYFIESYTKSGVVHQRLMLNAAPAADLVVEFSARVSLGAFAVADIYDAGTPAADPGTSIPVPVQFVESIFKPLAMVRFFASPCFVNYDEPGPGNTKSVQLIMQQAEQAEEMLKAMKPQGRKAFQLYPRW